MIVGDDYAENTKDVQMSKDMIADIIKHTRPFWHPRPKCKCGMNCEQVWNDIKDGKLL